MIKLQLFSTYTNTNLRADETQSDGKRDDEKLSVVEDEAESENKFPPGKPLDKELHKQVLKACYTIDMSNEIVLTYCRFFVVKI